MNSCELVSFVTAVACAIAKCAPKEDLPVISAILGELAATLATIIVHQDAIEDKKAPEVLPDADNAVVTIPPTNPMPSNR